MRSSLPRWTGEGEGLTDPGICDACMPGGGGLDFLEASSCAYLDISESVFE